VLCEQIIGHHQDLSLVVVDVAAPAPAAVAPIVVLKTVGCVCFAFNSDACISAVDIVHYLCVFFGGLPRTIIGTVVFCYDWRCRLIGFTFSPH
jgi:hypothetical protein